MPHSLTPELKKILKDADCHFVRYAKGDHERWFSPITNKEFTVDGHIKSSHTANAALKQAGLRKAF